MEPILALLVLSITSASALAQAPSTVVVPAQKTTPQTAYYMWPEEFLEYKGDYELSNGERLYLNKLGNKMFAQVGKQSRHEIIAIKRGGFVAVDNKMKMQIDISADGYVTGELSYVREVSGQIAGIPVEVKFTAR